MSETADSHHADQLVLAEIKANNSFLVKNGPFTAHADEWRKLDTLLLRLFSRRLARSTRHMATSLSRRGAPGFCAPSVKKKKRHSSTAVGITQARASGGVWTAGLTCCKMLQPQSDVHTVTGNKQWADSSNYQRANDSLTSWMCTQKEHPSLKDGPCCRLFNWATNFFL